MAGVKFLADLITKDALQFQTSGGSNAGKIEMDGNNLVLSNAVGDILFGDAGSNIYIGDGVNSIDILFEQSGSIRSEVGSNATLTLGSSGTTLNVYDPQMANGMTLTSTMTMGAGSTIDYLPDTGVFLKFDGQTILERQTANGAITLGHDDSIIIAGGDMSVSMNANINNAEETVFIGAEGGVKLYGFPDNDAGGWAARSQFYFQNDGKLIFGIAEDTNLYRSAANTLKTDDSFLVGGNVGIGTTVPTSGYKLDVAGSILSSVASGNTSVVVSTNNANGAINAIAGQGLEIATDGTNKNIAFRNGTSTSMYIKNGGNVGIGTTSPGAKLSIAAGASDANTEQIRFNRTNDEFRYNSIFSTISSSSSTAKISFGVHDGVTSTSQATVMSLLGNGNVGIGVTSPGAKLDVSDGTIYSIKLSNSAAYNSGVNNGIVFNGKYTSAGDVTDMASVRGGKENTVDTHYGGKLTFHTRQNGLTDTERMRITSVGGISFGSTGTAYGTSGQVLTSAGNASPTWETLTTGTVTGTGVTGEVAYWTSSTNIANNAGMSFSNEQVQFDGIGGADGFALPYDENPGYSNFSAGGFGALFRESHDSYLTGNIYYYKTGGAAGWRLKYPSYGATVLSSANGDFDFNSAAANTTAPYSVGISSKMIIKQSGNVGIGTTSPSHRVDIYSNENVPLRIHRPSNANLDSSGAWGIGFSTRGDAATSTSDTRAGIFSYYNGNLFLAAANTSIVADPDAYARLTILNTGYVGIGTTSPSQNLEVVGQTVINGGTGVASSGTLHVRQQGDSASDGIALTSSFATSHRIWKNSSGDLNIGPSTASSALVQLVNGNVGIGTTSPGTKLHIVVSGGSSQLTLERTGGGAGKVVLAGAVEGLIVYDDAYGPKMYVGTSGTYNGNVGIGTITPSQKLHVSGSARVTGAYYDSGNSAGTAGQVLSSTATGTGWVDATTGDITGVTATSPLTGGGTSGAVTVGIQTASASQAGALSAANWTTFNNKTSNTGTVTSVGTTGTVSGLTLTGTVTTSGNLTLGGTLSLTSANVTTGLGFTPYNATNPAGYTANTGTTTAANTQTFTNKSGSNLQWTNDAGYLTSAGDITGVTAGAGLSGGGVTGTVTVNVDYAGTDNIILTATNAGGTTIEDAASIMFSDDANNVKYAQISDLPFGTSNLAIGTTSTTAKAGNITTISTGQASAITTNSAKVGITTTQATAITNNTAKVGITTTQASNITTNNAKVGITTTQANAITANTAKVGITTTQASDITANNAKTGITSAQASAITANTAKVTDTGRPAIESDGTEPSLTSGMTAGDIRALIGAGTSSLAIGTGATNALRGDTTTISTAQATAITNNTAKVGITTTQATAITNNTAKVTDTGTPAILSDGSIPTLNSGITGAEVRTLIGAGTGSGTSNLVIGTTASTAMAGNTTTITTTQASDITTNNAKTGITSAQATAITNNTAKVTDTGRPAIESDGTEPSLTSGMNAGDIRALIGAGTGSSDLAIGTTASTAMAGDTTTISSTQASDITANNSKVSDTGTPAILSDGSVPTLNTNISAAEVRGLIGAGTSSLAIGTTASTAKAGDTTTISTAQAAAITANTAKVTDTGKPAIESDGTEPSLTAGMTAGDIRALIGAGTGDGTSDLVIGTGATNALRGDTTTITTTQAANIVTNNAKVSNVTQTTVSGNAGSATVLQNARTIAGVSFNGSANISLNNNAITNGAGYTTNTGDITGVTAGTGMSGGGNSGAVTLNCTIDTPGEVGLGNLSSSGNALAGNFTATGDITAYSDKRLKTNIETISGALEKVNALRGVTFDKDGKRGLGVIAQEVEKILPEVVLDGEEYKSVAYGNIVGVLIEAVKEQQKQINELKERLDGFTK
jgi:hypothetical protein